MPLVTFSKNLASKAFARNSQIYSSGTGECGAQHLGNPSLKGSKGLPRAISSSASSPSPSGKRPKQAKENIGRNRDRSSKAFTFSLDPFNVVASFRTRAKIKGEHSFPESRLCSRPVSHQSLSVYSGYEDEEYGEPEVDAEEIRRPSGLGQRASLTDINAELGEAVVGKYTLDHGSIKEFRPVTKATEETESRNDVSDTSDNESLVEIRYPSGLGNIKQAIRQIEIERPLSTYPHFEPSVVNYDASNDGYIEEDTQIPVQCPAPTAFFRSPSVYLSTLLPLLGLYLSPQILTSLTLVNRAVGKQARDLLWRSINLSVTIHSAPNKKMSIDGHRSNNLLDFISTGDVVHLVKSLELTCRLENTTTRLTSNCSSRSRPPPLILAPKTVTSLRSGNTLIVPPTSTQPRTAPLPFRMTLEAQPEHDVVATTPETGERDVTPSKRGRASLLLRNSSFTLKTNVPDALRTSAARLRPTSLRLPHALSLFRSRSSEALGDAAGTHTSQHSSSLSQVAESTALFCHSPSHVRDTGWAPPAEWNRVGTDSLPPPSPPSALLPSTGWRAPSKWLARPSLCPTPSSRPSPNQMSLHTRHRPPSLTTSNQLSDLRLSTSLPSLRSLNSPPGRSTYHQKGEPSSPVTTVPSPITPYSAISLSAFPLPPPSVTPPGVTPFSPEFSDLFPPEPKSSMSSTFTPTRDHVIESPLSTALKTMVNLEHVTLKYVPSESGYSGLNHSPPYKSVHESIDLSLVKKANETLAPLLLGRESLRSLKVVCPNTHKEVCRMWWQELTQSLKDFEIDVTSRASVPGCRD